MLFIPLTFDGYCHKVFVDRINYIRSQGRRIIINTKDETIDYYGRLTTVIPWLNDKFYQSHSCLIVNLHNIEEFTDKQVIFVNGSIVNLEFIILEIQKKLIETT
jgi:DNA-binding LytR/AlgR family response regulator